MMKTKTMLAVETKFLAIVDSELAEFPKRRRLASAVAIAGA